MGAPAVVAGAAVLELGAGTGLVGLVAHRLGAAGVPGRLPALPKSPTPHSPAQCLNCLIKGREVSAIGRFSTCLSRTGMLPGLCLKRMGACCVQFCCTI